MQPYQEASEAINRQGELPKRLLQNGLSAAATAIGGGAVLKSNLANKVMTMLNEHIPENLAVKGLNNLDPRFGNLINKAMESGMTWDDTKNFIFGKAQEGLQTEENKKIATDKKNLIEKHSPDLHKFIEQEMKKGRSHLEAGALAKIGAGGKNFNDVIEKLKKEHKTSWEQILEAVYGGTKSTEQNQPPAAQAPAQQAPQGQGQQQPDAQSQFKQELAALLKS
jgi:hypothetical protein